MALRERIYVEGACPLERELRGFLRAVRSELRVGGRRPLAARIGRRRRATRSRTPSLPRRRVRRQRAEQAQSDDFLREIEELQRSFENGAARKEGVAEAPEAPPPE